MERRELTQYLEQLLEPQRFRDYCPNGLQVEGNTQVNKIITGVSANQALIDAAIDRGADALIVHHGWFWANEDRSITGVRKRRIQSLLENNINLFAYHLPLDAHVGLGNNACLAKYLGWNTQGNFGEQDLGWFGYLSDFTSLSTLTQNIADLLHRQPLVIGNPLQEVHRVAWCSGGSQNLFEQALSLDVDVFISGEISEQHVHLAREAGVAYIAAGHHATERLGIQALSIHLGGYFELACEFVEIDNPV